MKHPVWPYFVAGFVVSFGLIAMVVSTYVMLPSGQAVTRVPLWRYYLAEWPRFFDTQTLGPASSNQDALLTTTLQHVALSLLAGAVVASLAWWLGQPKNARNNPRNP